MTEIAATPPAARERSRALRLIGVAAGSALVAAGAMALRDTPTATTPAAEVRAFTRPLHHDPLAAGRRPPAPKPTPKTARAKPQRASLDVRLSVAASEGLARGLFTRSPGGAVATAERVARWRPLIVRAARGSGFSPNLLEAIVFLESAGRSDAIAGADPAAAVGLTQIVASTGAGFLHMRVRLGASRRLTHLIWRAELRGRWARVRRLEARRRRVDQRFAPRASLRATVRYLTAARGYLGRKGLAVASYHMGIGNLQEVIRRWARAPHGTPTTRIVHAHDLSYARLYFSAAPDRHARAWRRLTSLGDDTRDYYWKILAAKRLMRLYRADPEALGYEALLQARKNSAEEVLHPRPVTRRFHTPREIARAWRKHRLRRIPNAPRRTHIVLARSLGEMAHRLGRRRSIYRGLNPDSQALLLYIGRRVHELSGARRPLIVTSAVRDDRYQRVLMRRSPNAARRYSLHTTGYAFDIARSYGSRRQAEGFQFVLERLQTLGLAAYIKESAAIHITVASGARKALPVLRRYG